MSAKNILQQLLSAGYEAYYCGGHVRDTLLKRPSHDIDITTNATPDQVKAVFTYTIDVGAAFGTVIVVQDGLNVEVTTYRRDKTAGRHPEVQFGTSLEEDAYRRDFTVNGLFMDIEGRVFDFVGGLQDLESEVIRAIGNPEARFAEDPLRILRAARFSVELNFGLDVLTARAIRRSSRDLRDLSAERIRDELTKGLTGSDPHSYINMLNMLEILPVVLPELIRLQGCPQDPKHHPEGDVWQHTLLTLQPHMTPELAWTCLLHDIAKPVCTEQEGDVITAHNHDKMGSDFAKVILNRLKFGQDFITQVTTAIANHMDHLQAANMRNSTFKHFISRPTHDLEMALLQRDSAAAGRSQESYEYILQRAAEIPPEARKPPRFITGHDLIALGLKPGAGFKKVLEGCYNAQLDGYFDSREQALATITRWHQETLLFGMDKYMNLNPELQTSRETPCQ